MIRPAKPSDIPALVELSIEALEIDAYPELVISRDRVKECVTECVSAASHFSWVSERDGEILGGLGATVYPLGFYERSQAIIVMWYCKNPGEGMRLMRQFLSWTEGRPMIKQIQYFAERSGDRRITDYLIKRYGFRNDVRFLYKM